MAKPTLILLAAGMASRYGSMKQTEGFGPNGETIMDYSIYDAIESGFGKIVFIIRKDFAADFEPVFNKKLAGKGVEICYVYQSLDKFTHDYAYSNERVKPWGTAHALLCTKELVHEPFAIINADDFYGKDAFKVAADFLNHTCSESKQAIVGYELKNTLSENGTVSRGVCGLNEDGSLKEVVERVKVYPKDGNIIYEEDGKAFQLADDAKASMNFWCFHPSVMAITEKLFAHFLQEKGQELKSEFFLPLVGDYLIKNNIASIAVLPSSAKWFGVTYKEDAPVVQEQINTLIKNAVYPADLWG